MSVSFDDDHVVSSEAHDFVEVGVCDVYAVALVRPQEFGICEVPRFLHVADALQGIAVVMFLCFSALRAARVAAAALEEALTDV